MSWGVVEPLELQRSDYFHYWKFTRAYNGFVKRFLSLLLNIFEKNPRSTVCLEPLDWGRDNKMVTQKFDLFWDQPKGSLNNARFQQDGCNI